MAKNKKSSWHDLEFYKKLPIEKSPSIGITKTGLISFNNAFTKIYSYIITTHMKIGYSKSNNAIGIKFIPESINDSSCRSLTVNKPNRGDGTAVNVTAGMFFKNHSIDVKKISGKYNFTFESINDEEYIVIRLSQYAIL